jgi:hypothetical protein
MSRVFRIPEMTFVDRFPSWRGSGPWPFEFGIAGLLLWMAECMHRVDLMRPRYQPPFAFFDWIKGYENSVSIAYQCVAVLIVVAFFCRAHCASFGKFGRSVGLLLSSFVFGVLAYSFLHAFPWSLGGAAYAFVAWRCFAVGLIHLRGNVTCANKST